MPENTRAYSPASAQPCTGIYIPYALFSARIVPVWADREASGMISEKPLQAEAEAIDLLVPLISDLVSVVQHKRLDLTQKMVERLGTEKRNLWLVRTFRAGQV
jgi:hypothetical protein